MAISLHLPLLTGRRPRAPRPRNFGQPHSETAELEPGTFGPPNNSDNLAASIHLKPIGDGSEIKLYTVISW